MQTVYPTVSDPLFKEKLQALEQFGLFKTDPMTPLENLDAFVERSAEMCEFQKTNYQHFVSQYISEYSPYRSLLVYHGLGSGKLCSAITIAEAFLQNHRLYEDGNVWIVSKKALKGSFEQEVFKMVTLLGPEFMRDQCTGESYYKLIPDRAKLSTDKLSARITKVIKSRYKFFGYEKFANRIQEWTEDGTLPEKIQNKIVIIDEAHNIRSGLDGDKKIIEPIVQFIEHGKNNRLVLLTATPMYNEPEELLWLLSLLCMNDKNDLLSPYRLPVLNETTYELIARLSRYYISYVRGTNPFTFPMRITPAMLNIPVLKEKWTKPIVDGLVPSVLRGTQLEYIKQASKNKISAALLRQLNNIAYTKVLTVKETTFTEGKEGLYSLFKKREGTGFQLEYMNPDQPILDPAFQQLQNYATKFHTLSEMLPGSVGKVIVYSNFIWGGLVPLAIMLEHLGLKRYGEQDILFMANKTKEARFPKGSSYCILAGDSELMGNTKIDTLLANIDNVKVVLMSPIAGEGLTFKNIREMHILDPWYHLNAIEQAIGRAIRNCSHAALDVTERNVSVFLHTTVYPSGSKETEDLHAYHIAADKQAQINKLDQIVKENAMDCGMYAQYYPKDLFPFTLGMKTSRGTVLMTSLGDDPSKEIVCKEKGTVPRDVRAFRPELYASYIPTLQQKLRKWLRKQNKTIFSLEELLNATHRNREVGIAVVQASLYPNKLWGNYALFDHYDTFMVLPFPKDTLQDPPVRLLVEETEEVVPGVECDLLRLWEGFALEPEHVMILQVYLTLDSVCWSKVAEDIIKHPDKITPKLQPIYNALVKQGAIIPDHNAYVNLFSSETDYEVFMYDQNAFREATPKETQKIIGKMKAVTFPDPTKIIIVNTLGFFQRYRNPKEPTSPYRFQFKLGLNNEKGKRSGVVCDSGMKKPDIEKELAAFMPLIDATGKKLKINISQMCSRLMYELYESNRFWLPPMYKPLNKK